MAIKDTLSSLRGLLGRQNGRDAQYTHRADGSVAGYHPNQGRSRRPDPVQGVAEDPYQPQPVANQDDWGTMSYEQPNYQQTGYQQTAFQQTAYQPTGYQPVQQQTVFQNTSYRAGQNTVFQQAQTQQTGYQSLFNRPANAQQPSAFGAQGWQPQQGPAFQGYVGQMTPQPAAPRQDNVVYMPQGGEGNRSYRHCMWVVDVHNVPSCYQLMGFMRNGESVLVNMESLADARERDRTLDLLYGAAYALNCTFTRVCERSLYLFTPADVLVQPCDRLVRVSDMEQESRWPDPASVQPGPRPAARDFRGYTSTAGYQPTHMQGGQYQRRASGNNVSSTAAFTDFAGGFGRHRK